MRSGEIAENDDFIKKLDAKVQEINEEDRKRGGHMISGARAHAADNQAYYAEGEAKGKAEMIVNMHEQGFALKVIASVAKKTVKEVKAVLKENGIAG